MPCLRPPCPVQQHLTVDAFHLLDTFFSLGFQGLDTCPSFLLPYQLIHLSFVTDFSFVQLKTWGVQDLVIGPYLFSGHPHSPSNLLCLTAGL